MRYRQFLITARATILHLLRMSRPSAIVRRVRAVVVDAIKAVAFRGPLAHIREEPREVIAPLLSDNDASASVVAVGTEARVVTASEHFAPCSIFWRQLSSPRLAVRDLLFANVAVQTTAAISFACDKRAAINFAQSAAIADARPSGGCAAWQITNTVEDEVSPESFSGQVGSWPRHQLIIPVAGTS